LGSHCSTERCPFEIHAASQFQPVKQLIEPADHVTERPDRSGATAFAELSGLIDRIGAALSRECLDIRRPMSEVAVASGSRTAAERCLDRWTNEPVACSGDDKPAKNRPADRLPSHSPPATLLNPFHWLDPQ